MGVVVVVVMEEGEDTWVEAVMEEEEAVMEEGEALMEEEDTWVEVVMEEEEVVGFHLLGLINRLLLMERRYTHMHTHSYVIT